MNDNYNFKLTPAYCLYNGASVLEENGSYIKFLLENNDDEILKKRLSRAFEKHLENVTKFAECPEVYKQKPVIEFVKGTHNQLRKSVFSLYEDDENKTVESCENKKNIHDDAAAVLLLDSILNEARNKKATDIHIEKNRIMFRINGILEKQICIKKNNVSELIQRIKVLAGMNVIDSRNSQDGHFIYGNKNPLFVRVSTIAVIGNEYNGDESVVLRLLDTTRVPLSLDYLGFTEKQMEVLRKLENVKNGLVLVCGPTGSGKSTTVASILTELEKNKDGSVKIISLEDPPEYVLSGVCQIHIDNNKNSYKSALKHIFRQDPDVIMIGKIRDEMSAQAALRASLTGHLVFATVHTGSVGESILRLENLGMDRNLLCSVIRGVICQELHFLSDGMKLYADIGLPSAEFSKKVNADMGEEELNELFIHVTNYSDLFSKTLDTLNKNNLIVENKLKSKRKEKTSRIWNGGQNAGKVHKRIV